MHQPRLGREQEFTAQALPLAWGPVAPSSPEQPAEDQFSPQITLVLLPRGWGLWGRAWQGRRHFLSAQTGQSEPYTEAGGTWCGLGPAAGEARIPTGIVTSLSRKR